MRDFSSEIDQSLDWLFKIQNLPSKKKDLFLDKNQTIYLQIRLFKVPSVRSSKRKFLKLVHSLYGDEPEICLFVPNRKTEVTYKITTDELIDFCVDFYKELLEKHNIKNIKTIMPLKQLRSEYGAFELRRKLVNRFDLFLCKNSLLYNPRFLNSLGNIFNKSNKQPMGVSFPKSEECDPEFEKNIERAIFTSSFYIKPFSDNYTIAFGKISNSKAQLKENLEIILKQICSENVIPGGFQNIRAMYIWPSQGKTIPLYVCPSLPKDLPNPKLKSKKKRSKTVEDEISTIPGKKVVVMANGDVIVKNDKRQSNKFNKFQIAEEEDEESMDEGSDVPEEENKINSDDEDNESENDEIIDKLEQRLLGLKREGEEEEEEAEVTPKKMKKIEKKTPLKKNKELQKKSIKKKEGGKSKAVKNVKDVKTKKSKPTIAKTKNQKGVSKLKKKNSKA